jgi:hypothetical protein
MRPRRGKALEQVEDGRDMLRENQRYGGSRRHGQTRVRARHGSAQWDYDSKDSRDYCKLILSYDGKDVMKYSGGSRGGVRKKGGRSPSHQWWSKSQTGQYSRDTAFVDVGHRGA